MIFEHYSERNPRSLLRGSLQRFRAVLSRMIVHTILAWGVRCAFCIGVAVSPVLAAFQKPDDPPPAVAAFERLKSPETALLAPKTLAQAQKAFDQYLRLRQQNKPESDIRNAYDQLEAAVGQVNDRIGKATSILADALGARQAAQQASAQSLAPKEYATAEARMVEALVRLEDGKAVEADRMGREAIPMFRLARITAIKLQLLGNAQTILAKLKNDKQDQLVPASYQQAQSLLLEVATRLDKDEPLTPELSALTAQVDYEARHAQLIAAKVDTLQKDERAYERLILEQESLVRQLAAFAGLNPDFMSGPTPALHDAIAALQSRQDSLRQTVSIHQAQTLQLQSAVDSLKTAFAQQQIRIASMVDEYQQNLQTRKEELEQRRREIDQDLKKRMLLDIASQAQTRFTPREMIVLRDQKSVTLRLLGLEFQPGETTIAEKNFDFLDRLTAFLLLYPKSITLIEGHTDVSGSETKNLELSEQRAAAVRDYVARKTGFSAEQLTSKGRGGTVPIADNATPKGREQNRRIDVIVSF